MKKRLLISLLTLLTCGLTTGLWASSIPGALSGRFTINASGEKVLFSQGNLQYQASTNTWRFATNQYDYMGSANANISESYTGWIDLFGWATNGLEANTATGKMPYYTGTTNEDYGPSITSGEFDKTIYDWGKAIDDNWHTLSNAEWNYIFAGRANYSSLYGFGRLFGVNGVFLLPDDWSWSETEIATAATATGFTWSGGAKTFSSNIISNNTLWSVMESAGAVFIPAAGYRQGTTINMSGNGGDYWSSTASSATNAYRTSFYDEHLNLSNNYGRSDGISVRLVRSSLEKDGEGNYLLSSAQDWKDFAAIVNSGTNPAANAKMTADINLGSDQTMIGTLSVPYQGSFDGQGHMLTVAYDISSDQTAIAPFACVNGATIQNLHVAGSIRQRRCAAGGVAGTVNGNLTVRKCWVSATLTVVGYGDNQGTIGGIASYCDAAGVHNSSILIEDCLFSGHIATGYHCGGIMSHVHGSDGYNNSAQFNNCLNIGTITGIAGSTGTFIRIGIQGDPYTITNCHYQTPWGGNQGTQASSTDLSNGATATALQNGRAETVWVQEGGQPMLAVFSVGRLKANQDPVNPGVYYTTFYHSTQKYLLPTGVEAYVATLSSDKLVLTMIAEGGYVIPAGNAVILKANAASVTLTPTMANAVTFSATNNLQGYDAATTAPANCYVLSGRSTDNSTTGVAFYQFSGTLKAHRAYVTVTVSDPNNAPGRLQFVTGEATDITEVQNAESRVKKYIQNGQLIIEKDGVRYNVQGLMVK